MRISDGVQTCALPISDDAAYLLQELVPWEGEAGIFYVRRPGQKRGEVFSMTLKYAPYVLGDGVRSLRQLIDRKSVGLGKSGSVRVDLGGRRIIKKIKEIKNRK